MCYFFPANFFMCYKYLRQKMITWSCGARCNICEHRRNIFDNYRKSREVVNGLHMVARFLHFI